MKISRTCVGGDDDDFRDGRRSKEEAKKRMCDVGGTTKGDVGSLVVATTAKSRGLVSVAMRTIFDENFEDLCRWRR